MTELVLLFAISLIGAEAWLRRQQSELAERLINHYCRNRHWQLISIARATFGIPLILSRLTQKPNTFVFEFSIDGVSKQESELYLVGLHQPLFRDIPDSFQTFVAKAESSQTITPAQETPTEPPRPNNVIPFPSSRQHH